MSICNRVIIVMLGSVLVVGFGSFLVFSTFLFDKGQIGILLSIPVGIAFGALTCWYIAHTHDLRTWSPKDPNWAHSKNKYIAWGVIVAAVINSFVVHFLGPFAVGFVFEVVGTCFLLINGFIMFHSCRNANS